MTLSKLLDALICLGFGVFVGVGVGDGLAELGVVEGAGEAASAAGSSSLHPNRNSSEAAKPTTAAALTGEEGTGEGYRQSMNARVCRMARLLGFDKPRPAHAPRASAGTCPLNLSPHMCPEPVEGHGLLRIDAIKRSTRSSVATKGSLQSTVRCAWSFSFRCTQSTV